MRSRKSIKCGEVNKPLRRPQARAMLSIIAQVLPLPLVPATWITCVPCAGNARYSRKRRRAPSSPSLIPNIWVENNHSMASR